MENRRRILVLMTPPALWLFLLFLLPLAIMTVFSFRAGTFGAQREVFTFENYRDFLTNTAFQRLLWRSLVIAFVVSIFAVVLAYPVAYFLAFRAGSLKFTLLTITILPAWTSYLLRVLAWKLILGSGGLLNSFLLWAGWIDEALPILLYSRDAVIVALTYVWIPWVALPIFAVLEGLDRSLLEAAADLSCPPWEAFLRITLPLSLPGVIAGFFFVFIPTVGEYVTPMLLGGADGIMYGNMIQDQFARCINWPMGSVMSLVMLVAVLVLIFIFTRLVRLQDLVGL
jgi:spermidine/putrescine transport system permease protein